MGTDIFAYLQGNEVLVKIREGFSDIASWDQEKWHAVGRAVLLMLSECEEKEQSSGTGRKEGRIFVYWERKDDVRLQFDNVDHTG